VVAGRRLMAIVALVVALLGATIHAATADLHLLPLPALPIGPGPLFPMAAYGPTPNDDVVLKWDEQTLMSIRQFKTPPPIATRALAIVHTSMFDAWAAYDASAVGTRLGGSLRRPAAERTLQNKSEAISYAAYRALLNLYPAKAGDFRTFLAALGYDPDDASTDPATAAGVGNTAAAAVLAYRAADGSNQAGGYADSCVPACYQPVNSPDQINDPMQWQPLRNPDGTVQKFVTPHWRNVTPFALTSATEFQPPAPTRTTLLLLDQEITDTLLQSATLTDLSKMRAEYWADGPGTETPPGHWCTFAQATSRARGYNLDQDAKLFFALTSAELDASIAAWNAKRLYNYVRPITAVHVRKQNQLVLAWAGPYKGTRLIWGQNWMPYLPTPSFPEYVSGHSTFSGAGARILQQFTGADTFGGRVTIRPGSSTVEPGATPLLPVELLWATYSSAREEAGNSRRQGGIHFPDADQFGQALGASVGANAWAKAQTYFNGTAG
jgi:hypothetical protein